jgi:uncharacterized membrane protein HdeD (DUF308 family)
MGWQNPSKSRAEFRRAVAGRRQLSAGMSHGLARNWWAVGLRGLAAVGLGIAVLVLPPSTLAALVFLFAAYLAGDGIFALIAAMRGARPGQRWWLLAVEGTANLMASAALSVSVVIAVPLIDLACIWAVVSGAFMLAAARRLSLRHGRWLLISAATASVAWGVLGATLGITLDDGPQAFENWLAGYGLCFGVLLLLLGLRLWRRDRERQEPTDDRSAAPA